MYLCGLFAREKYYVNINFTNMKKIYSILLLAALCFGNMQAETLQVGTDATALVGMPVVVKFADKMYCTQTVYPATDLVNMKDMSITKLTYQLKALNPNGDYEKLQIRLLEVDYTTLATSDASTSFKSIEGATLVYEGSLAAGSSLNPEVTLTNAFEYKGGNLLIDVRKTVAGGSYAPSSSSGSKGRFKGTYTPYYVSLYNYGDELPTTGTPATYYPNITFTYEEPASSGCANITAPVASEITATSAKLTWEKAGEVEDYQFECVRKGVAPSWTAAAQKVLTVTLDTLKADTEYDFYVRAYCGAGEGEQGNSKKVSFQTEKSCYAPTLLSVVEAETTTTSAKITWHASGKGETTYQYTYALYGQSADWTNAPTTTEKEVTLTGLTPKKSYQVWVRSYCAADDQSEAITEYFSTKVDCSAAALPYEDDFSSGIDCWTLKDCNSNTGEYGYYGEDVFRFYYTTTPPQYLISPEFVASAKQIQVSFEYFAYSHNYEESFKVGYSTTDKELASFTWGEELKTTNDHQDNPDKFSAIFPVGVKYVAIQHTSNYMYFLLIDNFKAEEYEAPACAAPTALTVSEVADKTAKATWTSEAEKFALELKAEGGEWTAVDAVITEPAFELTNLSEHTTYKVRVKAICDTDFESEWVESEAFTTECSVKEYGYAEIFAAELEACWDNSEYHGNQWSIATDDYEDYFLRYKSSDNAYGFGELVTPAIAIPSESEPVVLFEWMNTGVTGVTLNIWNGETEAVLDADLDTELNKVTGDADSRNWKVMKANLTAYKGKTVAFKFHADGNTKNKYVFLDNFTVAQKPYSLLIPDNVEAEATEDGAIVTWTPAWDEPAWDLSYSVKDADSWTLVEDLAATTYTITGLAEGEYEVRVRAAFEAAQSLWSEAAIFEVVKPTDPTAISNTAVKATAIKRIVNGQLIIERNGEQYNAQGVSVK